VVKAGFYLQDDTMPRTVYWEHFTKALKQSEHFAESDVDLLIPLEDTAMETNWPRYGNPNSAYIRGSSHDLSENGAFQKYFAKVIACGKDNPDRTFLYVNMNPFFRAPLLLRQLKNVIVADISLSMFERDMNRNTISMPALPIVFCRSAPPPGLRPIMASFQGRIDTHPVRKSLKSITESKGRFSFVPWRRNPRPADDRKNEAIVVKGVELNRHIGKVDAINSKTDAEYERLLANSNFAFVPRGDSLFSYRLAEVMSFGCIPIILSDGWILPFDRTLPWDEFSLRVHADAIPQLSQIIAEFTADEILSRRDKVLSVYQTKFASLNSIVGALMAEVQKMLSRP
jgi:hypothetical protein